MSVSKCDEEGGVWYLQTHWTAVTLLLLDHEPTWSILQLLPSANREDQVRGGCMLGSYLEILCGHGSCRGTEGICSVIFSEPGWGDSIWLPCRPRFDWASSIDGRVVSLYLSKCFWEEELWNHCYFIFRYLWSFVNLLIKMSGIQRKWQIKSSFFIGWIPQTFVIRLNIHGRDSWI